MWDYFEPKELQWYEWRLDGGRLLLHKNGEEWRIVVNPTAFIDVQPDSGGPVPTAAPDEVPVAFTVGKGKRVALRPHFGEYPYLITARNDVRILSGAEAQFAVALPPRFSLELEDGTMLMETSLFTLSSTWFGDKASGTLCLSIPLLLDPTCNEEKNPTSEVGQYHYLEECRSLIHCDIVVRNTSKLPLDLKRIAIYTDLLNIYEKNGYLYADTVLVDTTADGSLRMSVQEQHTRGRKRLHTGNKAGLNELLVRRGVKFLKAITGM
ncbi:MAG: hypothetical protein SNJ56_03700 [Termitinemataceae bacterium]